MDIVDALASIFTCRSVGVSSTRPPIARGRLERVGTASWTVLRDASWKNTSIVDNPLSGLLQTIRPAGEVVGDGGANDLTVQAAGRGGICVATVAMNSRPSGSAP